MTEKSLLQQIKDWLKGWDDDRRDRYAQGVIAEIQNAETAESLNIIWTSTLKHYQEREDVLAAHEARKMDLGPREASGLGGQILREVFAEAAEGLGGLDDLAGEKIASMILKTGEKMTGIAPSSNTKKILGGTDVSEAYRGAVSYCADIIIGSMVDAGGELDERQREKVEDSLRGLVTLFGGSAAAIAIPATIGDLLHPAKQTNLGRAVNLMYEMVGFKSLRDATLGPLKRGLIEQPLKYQWNEILQPWYPQFRDSHEAYGRGHIGDEQFKQQMRISGIKWEEETTKLDFFQMYKRASAAPSSYFMLNAIGKEGLYDRERFKFWLSDAGYGAFEVTEDKLSEYEKEYGLSPPGQSQIDFLADMYSKMHVRTFVGDPRSLWKKFYGDGKILREEYETWLSTHGISAEDAKESLDAIDEDFAWDVKKEYQSTFEKRYLYGRIDVDGLRKDLKELGLRDDYIDARIERLTVQKEGKTTEEKTKFLTKAEVLRIYEKGGIERGEAYRRLDIMGYVPDDIELLLTERELKMEEEVEEIEKEVIRPLSKAEVISLYKKGIITRPASHAYLVGFEYLPEDVELLLEKADIEIEEVERKAAEKVEREAEREAAEARRPVRLLSKADILRLYGEFLMTREEAAFHLEELGWTPFDADLLLSYEDSKIIETIEREEIPAEVVEEKKTRLLSKAEAISLYKKGLISRVEIPVRLAELGYSSPDVEMFTRVLDIDADQEKIIALFLDGFISREEAKTRLESAGYFPSDVEKMLVEAEKEK